MKRFILPLIALTLLVGACSSSTSTVRKQDVPPKSTGTRATAWGELPTYDQEGYKFQFPKPPPHLGIASVTPVTLDVVVNADGSVEDATVVASSGNAALDRAALSAFIGARYSLQLSPGNPAPYVVRQQIKFSKDDGEQLGSVVEPYGGIGRQDSMPPSGAPYYQPVAGAGTGLNMTNSSTSSSSSSTN